MAARFDYAQAEEIRDAFARYGVPIVCHLDDIIASKTATNRVKDRESLPRLKAFREYWVRQQC
jgi:hypothetical protein